MGTGRLKVAGTRVASGRAGAGSACIAMEGLRLAIRRRHAPTCCVLFSGEGAAPASLPHQAWRSVVEPTDASWIDAQIKASRERPGEPCAGAGPALERMLASGADRADIHEVVRAMQYDLLFSLCYLLDDPGSLEPELADLSWGLFRTDDDGEPTERIESLHESVLETDPSGNEMRPSPR